MKKQKHLFETLLSSNDVFSRCISILNPEYFDGEVRLAVQFTLEYFNKYKSIPDIKLINSEYDLNIEHIQVPLAKVTYTCDEIERFCKESAVALAINESLNDLQEGNLGIIVDRVKRAVEVSLKKDLGWNIYGPNFLDMLNESLAKQQTISTGIKALDMWLNGGFARQQTTIFTANSGIGKSVMLNNVGYNYSAQGYHVVYLSLELPKTMVFTRSSAIISGYDVKTLGDHTLEVASVVDNVRHKTDGTFMIQRIAGDSCSNDIRSYLTHYEMEYQRRPDVLVVDYLDKMTPNSRNSRLSISEQDKFKSEELAEVVLDYDLIGVTASQQNRDAIDDPNPKQSSIAGGLTKINTVDNVISLFMNDQMRLNGEMYAYFLKTRSSDGVGRIAELSFDAKSLRITDRGTTSNNGLFDITKRKQQITEGLKGITGLEYDPVTTNAQSALLKFMEELE